MKLRSHKKTKELEVSPYNNRTRKQPQSTERAKKKASRDCSAVNSEDVRTPSVLQKRTKERAYASHGKGVQFCDKDVISPHHCFFGYSSFSLLTKEEEESGVFNPYTFIKNIPSQSQLSKPNVREIPVKTRSTPVATLVLDLEETLVYSSLNSIENAEHTFHTYFQDHVYKVSLIMRPHVKEFLQRMSKHYEIFMYTSAKKEYAEKILEVLDPEKKTFRHRLYREDCLCVSGHYVKDLGILERDLAKTVVLDNAPHTFPYHVMNMIPIKSWTGDMEDKELLKLIPYLEKLSEADDFRHVLKQRGDHLHRILSED